MEPVVCYEKANYNHEYMRRRREDPELIKAGKGKDGQTPQVISVLGQTEAAVIEALGELWMRK